MAGINKSQIAMGFWIAAGFALFGVVMYIARGALSKAESAAL